MSSLEYPLQCQYVVYLRCRDALVDISVVHSNRKMIRKILFFILISFLAKAENDADFKQRFAEMEEIIRTMQKVKYRKKLFIMMKLQNDVIG